MCANRCACFSRAGKWPQKPSPYQMASKPSSLRSCPSGPGRHAFSVAIAAQTGERTEANNRVVVSADVLESRVRILMVAGSPSADLSYLRRVLEADANMEVEVLVRASSKGWAREVQRAMNTLDGRDVVVPAQRALYRACRVARAKARLLCATGRRPFGHWRRCGF